MSNLQTATISTPVLLKAMRRRFREYTLYSRRFQNRTAANWRFDKQSTTAEAETAVAGMHEVFLLRRGETESRARDSLDDTGGKVPCGGAVCWLGDDGLRGGAWRPERGQRLGSSGAGSTHRGYEIALFVSIGAKKCASLLTTRLNRGREGPTFRGAYLHKSGDYITAMRAGWSREDPRCSAIRGRFGWGVRAVVAAFLDRSHLADNYSRRVVGRGSKRRPAEADRMSCRVPFRDAVRTGPRQKG